MAKLARERSDYEAAARLVDALAIGYARDAARDRTTAGARTFAIAAATARGIAEALRAAAPR